MNQNVVGRLRDYLAARDLSPEVAGGSVVGESTVDHLSGAPLLVLERLASPLPSDVRRVATVLLTTFGMLAAAGLLFVVCGGFAVVLMPIVMGREGVGTAMITLFAVCVTAVVSAITLLAARGAARVIRRERRGVRTLYLFCVAGLIVMIVALSITQWLRVAFFAVDGKSAGINWPMIVMLAEVVFAIMFVWAAVTLRRFERVLAKV